MNEIEQRPESDSPTLDQGTRVWVWFCGEDGRAVEVSNIDPDEFSFPGRCRACDAPLSKPREYVLVERGEVAA